MPSPQGQGGGVSFLLLLSIWGASEKSEERSVGVLWVDRLIKNRLRVCVHVCACICPNFSGDEIGLNIEKEKSILDRNVGKESG